MKVLFCGTLLPEKYETRIKHLSSAGNRFQWNFIRGLKKAGVEVIIISFIGIPLDGVDTRQLEEDSRSVGINVVLKGSRAAGSIYEFQKKMKALILKIDWIISYNVIYAWLNLSKAAHKKDKKSALILADYTQKEAWNDTAHKLYAELQLRATRQYDMVVALSLNIKDIIRKEQKFLVMEGGIDTEIYKDFYLPEYTGGETLRLMYAGLLSQVTGIDLLLKAFSKIKNDKIELVITGKGELEELLDAYQKNDPRILYFGHLQYSEYLDKLREAHILINPRNMGLAENENNFPSKIMEYLASGRVIVSTQFAGWEHFQENIFFCLSEEKALCNAIQQAIRTYPDICKEVFGKNRSRALKFRWESQVERVLEMMKKM